MSGHDDRHLDVRRVNAQVVIRASVNPFTANFAVLYAVCGTPGPSDAQKPFTLLVFTM